MCRLWNCCRETYGVKVLVGWLIIVIKMVEMKRWDMRHVVLDVCLNDSERQSVVEEDDGVDNGTGTSVSEQCTCWVSNSQ